MKVLVCPDKFKGSLTALEVAQAIELGIKRFDSSIETVLHPLADGGDGSVALINEYLNLDEVEIQVKDPLGREIKASYAFGSKHALIEMARASGLDLLKTEELDIMKASSYGTGQMIADAMNRGAEKIFLFIGGSATNDGGIGMAAACGYRFLDIQDQILEPNGEALNRISSIDTTNVIPTFSSIEFITVCDVDNLFFGENGAAFVYAKQKGATADQIIYLDHGLRQLSTVIKAQLDIDIVNVPGAGAAGGVGGGSMAFFNAKLESGIETIMSLSGFDSAIEGVDLIISGEGRADHQSLRGKVISGVAKRCAQKEIPLGLIVGKNELSPKDQQKLNLISVKEVRSIAQSLDDAILRASSILPNISHQLMGELEDSI